MSPPWYQAITVYVPITRKLRDPKGIQESIGDVTLGPEPTDEEKIFLLICYFSIALIHDCLQADCCGLKSKNALDPTRFRECYVLSALLR